MTKRGRAPKFEGMKFRHTIRVTDNENDKINEYCNRTGQSKSDLFREALMQLLNNKEKEN